MENDEFQADQVLTIAGGHFVHDTYSAFIAPLLPVIQERLSTNYALTGGLAIFAQLPSVLNPLIGYAADRISLRYFIILAPGVTATIMSSLGLVSSYTLLALLLLAGGVSIAAFHAPAPAMIGEVSGARVGRGMSIFMAAGELGRTLGPLVVVGGLSWFGLEGMWRLAAAGWLVSGLLYLRLRYTPARPRGHLIGLGSINTPQARRFFGVLGLLMLARIFMFVSLTTYLPLYMSDVADASLELAASALTILEGAGIVGALFAGTLSDRLGRKPTLLTLLVIAPVIMMLFLAASGWLLFPLLLLLGLSVIAPTPVFLAAVQDQFTDSRALANGIFLMLNFLVRAVGIWTIGTAADIIGLQSAFTTGALAALLSIPLLFLLPTTVREPAG